MNSNPATGAADNHPHSLVWDLAAAAADAGDYDRVVALFQSVAVDQLDDFAGRRWRDLLLEAGANDLAVSLPGAPVVAESDQGDAADEDFTDFDPGPAEEVRPQPLPADLVRAFVRWFGGRADVYARQWHDARRDRTGYWPVREPLTEAVATAHLLGRITVGQYVLFPDDTVAFAALDLDPVAEAVEQVRLAEGGLAPLAYEPLAAFAARLVSVAEAAGLRAFAEDSGGFGLHVWFFFAPRIAAAHARSLLRELLWRAGAQPPSVSVELFPKQDRLGGKGFGNLIKLPLGLHQATLRPSAFLDRNLAPMAAADALVGIAPCDPAALVALHETRVVSLRPGDGASPPDRVAPPGSTAARVSSPASARGLAEALAAIEAGVETTRAVDRVVRGCGVVRELLRRAHEDGRLGPDEARALVYTVGLVGRANPPIADALAKAGVSSKELERVRRGLQGPAGCRRLAALVPGGCRGTCPSPPPGGYATPALFAFQRQPALRGADVPVADDELFAAAPATAILEQIDRRLARIESALTQPEPHPPGGEEGGSAG